jgi:hypothetical protein
LSQNDSKNFTSDLCVSPGDFFKGLVRAGLERRKLQTYPVVETYLVNLLQHYLDARNLFDPAFDEAGNKIPSTLAEMYLHANTTEDTVQKIELLKKLGDRSLYMSGFFGASLERKAIDLDYYVNMGGVAYATLATYMREDTTIKVYSTISSRFIDFVDVFTHISHDSFIQTNESLLRLYDRYLMTGSELAREKLVEMGVLNFTTDPSKTGRQY